MTPISRNLLTACAVVLTFGMPQSSEADQLSAGQRSEVERIVRLRSHFTGRTLRDREELGKLLAAAPLVALGDVAGDRRSRRSDLRTKPEVGGECPAAREPSDLSRRRASLLPRFDVLKSPERRHASPIRNFRLET